MKIAIADPPYIGCARLYRDHPDYSGEVDHIALIERLEREFDGWVLHASATPTSMAILAPLVAAVPGARWMCWNKGFAAFKRNVSVAYAWEPVIVKAARKPVVSKRLVMRDWVQESITLKRGLTGAKPEKVCHWAFEMVGARPDDELYDLFPGTGAIGKAWETWKGKFVLPADSLVENREGGGIPEATRRAVSPLRGTCAQNSGNFDAELYRHIVIDAPRSTLLDREYRKLSDEEKEFAKHSTLDTAGIE